MAETDAPTSESQVPRRDAPSGDPASPPALISLVLTTGWYAVVALLYLIAYFTHR